MTGLHSGFRPCVGSECDEEILSWSEPAEDALPLSVSFWAENVSQSNVLSFWAEHVLRKFCRNIVTAACRSRALLYARKDVTKFWAFRCTG